MNACRFYPAHLGIDVFEPDFDVLNSLFN